MWKRLRQNSVTGFRRGNHEKVQNCVNIGVEVWTAQALNYVSCSVAISFPEAALLCQPERATGIPVADQKDRGLWERDWQCRGFFGTCSPNFSQTSNLLKWFTMKILLLVITIIRKEFLAFFENFNQSFHCRHTARLYLGPMFLVISKRKWRLWHLRFIAAFFLGIGLQWLSFVL